MAGALEQIRQAVRQYRAALLVIDGAGLIERLVPSEVELAEFNMALQSQVGGLGCTTLLLAHQVGPISWPNSHLMDGIVLLHDNAADLRQVRLLEVV